MMGTGWDRCQERDAYYGSPDGPLTGDLSAARAEDAEAIAEFKQSVTVTATPAAERFVQEMIDDARAKDLLAKPTMVGATEDHVAAMEAALDDGIRRYVVVLRAAGVETFESCEGGEGHAYPEPTVRFHGSRGDGWKALAAALTHRLPVTALRLSWPVYDGGPNGPYWEMTFKP